jgi:hypothetical protein
MKIMEGKASVGALTVLLEFDLYKVQGARLTIPLLGIDQHVGHLTQFESLPAGMYDATITAFLTAGGETVQKTKIKILPKQGNLYKFNLSAVPQEVVLRPVDAQDRTILFSEIKIEDLDINFRPLRDEKGVAYKLRPGDYRVRVVLPNLRVKTFNLRVAEDVNLYTLPVEGRHKDSRQEPRVQISVPVEYRTNEGTWVPTKTINISSTGICLIKKYWSLDDENIKVRLFVPVSETPLECPARVRWVKDEGTSVSEMGLELFLTADMKEILTKWLSRKPQDKDQQEPEKNGASHQI